MKFKFAEKWHFKICSKKKTELKKVALHKLKMCYLKYREIQMNLYKNN